MSHTRRSSPSSSCRATCIAPGSSSVDSGKWAASSPVMNVTPCLGVYDGSRWISGNSDRSAGC